MHVQKGNNSDFSPLIILLNFIKAYRIKKKTVFLNYYYYNHSYYNNFIEKIKIKALFQCQCIIKKGTQTGYNYQFNNSFNNCAHFFLSVVIPLF